MGLNERRKIKELQETTLPERVKEIEEICGAPISYDVDWESFSEDLDGSPAHGALGQSPSWVRIRLVPGLWIRRLATGQDDPSCRGGAVSDAGQSVGMARV